MRKDRTSHCPTKEQKGNSHSDNSAKQRLSAKCNHCGKAGHKKNTAGNCWRIQQSDHPAKWVPVNMLMFMWTIAGLRLSMSYALLKVKFRNTVKDM